MPIKFLSALPLASTKKFHTIFTRVFTLCIGALLLLTGCTANKGAWDAESYSRAAAALLDKGLYHEALEVYSEYLKSPVIKANKAPTVLYTMGNIYMDNLNDPTQALACYIKSQSLDPQETFGNELGAKIVSALEKMGRTHDAQATLQNLTSIQPQSTSSSLSSKNTEKVVAQLGDRKITLTEIEESLGGLPQNSLEKNQLVQQYISTLLLAEAAERKGLNKKPSINNRLQFAQKQILAQANLADEIKIPTPSTQDLETFYKAYADRYPKDSFPDFTSAKDLVYKDWAMQKQNEAYQGYLQKLLDTDRIRFFPLEGR